MQIGEKKSEVDKLLFLPGTEQEGGYYGTFQVQVPHFENVFRNENKTEKVLPTIHTVTLNIRTSGKPIMRMR